MNQFFTRRNVVIIAVAAIFIIGGIVGWYFWTQREIRQMVTFTFSKNIESVTITGDIWVCKNGTCDNELFETKLSTSGQVELKDGVYYVAASGDTISNEATTITVDSNHTEFTINPYYSDGYLTTLLTNETDAIQKSIWDAYPTSKDYIIDTGRLYQFGDWYATSLALPVTENNLTPDIYYVILHKTDGVWQVVGKPSLYFKYTEHQNIPRDIINDVNAGINNTNDEDVGDGE